jgi:hypothetical protein
LLAALAAVVLTWVAAAVLVDIEPHLAYLFQSKATL